MQNELGRYLLPVLRKNTKLPVTLKNIPTFFTKYIIVFLKISRKIRKPANVWSANVSHTTVYEAETLTTPVLKLRIAEKLSKAKHFATGYFRLQLRMDVPTRLLQNLLFRLH